MNEMKEPDKVRVGFWPKTSGNYFSSKRGLTPEQVNFFKSLSVGDRIILWRENLRNQHDPHFVLAKYQAKTPEDYNDEP